MIFICDFHQFLICTLQRPVGISGSEEELEQGEIITSTKLFKHYDSPTHGDYRFSTHVDYIFWNTGGVMFYIGLHLCKNSIIEGSYVLTSLKFLGQLKFFRLGTNGPKTLSNY